ncbi:MULTISPECIES: hypothetical protein [Enterobacteriaceae]|uniref:hypothetical protein n=1 Tax=Enterobacteriaceae TaxID=543 RepID=UPI001C6FDC50|nr:hypothetical protein [Citrobacter freundii]MBW9461495.1 hypothetical protein [Kluyvera sp. EC_51]HBW1511403.1 hypothetical protein [Klebsiella quasipneumoniae subsp. similipneumoniae]HCM5959537.1 hypothetical protein [Klebsiella quasipneumoniae]EIJ8971772.1 hypothetical protein [Citrobacter freundii]EIJ8977017.1 hypothetical protein [Citrobacter freundii]
MNKNDKDSHLGALSKLLANEALQKEMVSTEQPHTSTDPENNKKDSFLQASEVKQLPGDDSNHECADVDLSPVAPVDKGSQAIEHLTRQILAQENTTSKKQILNGGEDPYLRDIDFRWLKGDANERAIFWFWIYIRTASNSSLNLPELKLQDDWDLESPCLYSFFRLSDNPVSSAERSRLIITFFNKLSDFFSPNQIKKSFEHIRSIWLHLISPVRQFKWLKKKDYEGIEWAWEYLLKRKDFNDNILFWFKPADANEKYIAIMGAIDCWVIRGNKIDCQDKKLLLDNMKKAFQQRGRRDKKKSFSLNTEISIKTRRELKELVKLQGSSINKFIEGLISDEYRRYKDNPNEYKISLLKKKQ